MAVDGDTKNSTFSLTFKKAHHEKFVECFIAEQNMVSVATGFGCRRKVPFASTFGAFFSRAYDQIRMAGVSKCNLKLCGSHSGCSIGEDGPSQMALEDLAMFRAIPNATVLYPSDAVSAERAVQLAANNHGIFYIRTSRPNTTVIYNNDEKFEIGKSKVVKQSDQDKILIVAAGITLENSVKAHAKLQEKGIHARIIDIFSVKPVDKEALIKNAKEAGNLILTVEDHYVEGGIHEAVCSALAQETGIKVFANAVSDVPRSGKPDELLALYKLDADSIVARVEALLA